ncbi:MAG: hypothetical protein PVJ76_02885 [Gemmatimonadota bacterium]|jgi:hypothetical protein
MRPIPSLPETRGLRNVRTEAGEAALTSTSGKIHPLLLVALVLVLGLLIRLNRDDPLEAYRVPVETSLRETIYVTVLALEAEFEERGAYPSDLESIGMDEEGLRYSLGSRGYTLEASAEGVSVEYESGQDLEPLEDAFFELLPPYEVGR